MSAILTAFGIDWRLLVINIVNFAILLTVLWYFLYRPVVSMLDQRRQKVAQGVHDAEAAGKRLQELGQEEAKRLAEATQQADTLLSEARAAGAQRERALIAQGEVAAAAVLAEAERQATETQREAIAKSKEEVAKLIVLGMERLMKKQHSN